MQNIGPWTEEVLNSLEGIERPAANPFLFEKIKYRMEAGRGSAHTYSGARLAGWAVAILLIVAANGFSIANKIQKEKHILHTELYRAIAPEIQTQIIYNY